MVKKFFYIFLYIFLYICLLIIPLSLQAQEFEEDEEEREEIAGVNICETDPFAAGCSFIGVGVILGQDSNGDFVWGLSGNYGYFILRRLAVRLNGSFTIFNNKNRYNFGPDLNYYIGPVFGWILSPGYGFRGIWQTRSNIGRGYIHGPIGSIETLLSRRVRLGVELFYQFINFEGRKSEDFTWSPSIRFSF